MSFDAQERRVPRPAPLPPLPEPLPAASSIDADFVKARFQHELDADLEDYRQQSARYAATVARDVAREDAETAAEIALRKSVHDAYVAVAQTSIVRSLTRAATVTTTVASIVTLYTGLLGLIYSSAPNAKPLSVIALVPAVFLGSALLLVAFYTAMFRRSVGEMPSPLPTGIGGQIAELRLAAFIRWASATISARVWALHAGILSFAIGVVCLPLPFVTTATPIAIIVLAGGLTVVLLTALVTQFGWQRLLDWVSKLLH